MKEVAIEIFTSSRVFAGVCMGISAALANAGIIDGWIPIVVAAAFTPLTELKSKGK